ncbi:MAG TPA: DUF72 domain-containing protein [Verrucomicrobiae bacterium]|nr:DUF72 domain-containing protein [Verrucomicrobiae bacterium]
MIYVGTCGFSYKDWIAAFYPAKIKAREMLPYYASVFCAVEIDSSYYGVPTRAAVESMAARTGPEFRFSFKAPSTVTHPAEIASGKIHADAAALLQSLAPMVREGKLACVLAQFPNGFKPEPRNEAYLRRVVAAFEGLPVVVEFRNAGWQRAETIELLRELGAGYANVDMPRLEGLLHPSSDATAAIGYVRFHGRNARTWWRGSNVTRYDYAYSLDELEPWTDRIAEIEEQTQQTYVFFNNHAKGNAARNALEMAELLEDRYGEREPGVVARPKRSNPEQAPLDFAGGPG